jgi:hypothetical protein
VVLWSLPARGKAISPYVAASCTFTILKRTLLFVVKKNESVEKGNSVIKKTALQNCSWTTFDLAISPAAGKGAPLFVLQPFVSVNQ